MKHPTGPAFDPDDDRNCYFIASNPSWLIRAWNAEGRHARYMLTAVNDLRSPTERRHLAELIDGGVKVLLDSGIFNLSMSHARAHGIHMDEALNLAPHEIDGFDALWDLYASVVDEFRDRLWGVIELDQGGAARKRVTRARIEADLGIVPIPVYHPFGDGWDYFDELAGEYDRICFGNVVQAHRAVRSRLLSTAWERTRAYPDLWVHLLGVTPNPMTYAFPSASCDSSSLIAPLRFGVSKVAPGGTASSWDAGERAVYDQAVPQDHPRGWARAAGLAMSSSTDLTRQWRGHLDALERVGLAAQPHRSPHP